MKIAVCDDSEIDREMITDLLNRYFADKSVKYHVVSYSTGQDLIYDVEEGEKYNIVIADGILEKCGEMIREVTSAKTAAIVTDSVVDTLYSETVKSSLEKSGFDTIKFVFKKTNVNVFVREFRKAFAVIRLYIEKSNCFQEYTSNLLN